VVNIRQPFATWEYSPQNKKFAWTVKERPMIMVVVNGQNKAEFLLADGMNFLLTMDITEAKIFHLHGWSPVLTDLGDSASPQQRSLRKFVLGTIQNLEQPTK